MKKMTSIKMKQLLEDRLANPEWNTKYNRDKDTFRVEWKDTNRGIDISLPGTISKWEERKEKSLDELEEYVIEALKIMNEEHSLEGKEKSIFPVIRATSFALEAKSGDKLIYSDHTAETRIYYALDLGKSYRLIDETFLSDGNGWTKERIEQVAKFNIRSVSPNVKKDTVADNTFYFISNNDGYDASHILNDSLLEEMSKKAKGELAISVPHQDVCIIADIENPTGYDILAQMAMQFFADGRVPITSLSFLYEDKKLEPIFILAQNKRADDKQDN